ncbi:ABC transporter ATP-binding protein [Cyclobacterium qasimii]|uniref:ATP-binding protein n=2 Tax=Cyclobacterium qasimii TaxID=1350429 RepID=S7VCK6_9BACT|nr:ATP-binding cassette domain-containing protein [Cyclobacterium qasimii]EPR67990.1 ATP-binding protein [Cyclobacterium qasimii M12-11B]GEO23001.1 ATP-binding protein [Cyclobacterium qasimii]
MIKIDALKKIYGTTTVLDIPALTIPKSQCLGLVGNNGAGKTTLFRVMLDLVRATEGAVTVDEEEVSKGEQWKTKVGAYLDENMLLSYLSPEEYFTALRKIYRLSEEDLQLHLEKFHDFFNGEILESKKYIRDLSKGNIKKVGIAAALLGKPEAVLLDEPFENLDPSSQIRLKKLILKEKEENQVTFLISSHDLNHVAEICERIVLLEKGVIIKDLDDKSHMTEELNNYFNVI